MRARRTLLALVVMSAISAPVFAQEDLRASALVGIARVKRDAGDLAASATFWEQARAAHALSAAELTEYFWVVKSIDGKVALQVAREILRTVPASDAVRDGAIAVAVDLGDESSVVALAEEGRLLNDKSAHWPHLAGDSHMRRGRAADAATAYAAAVQKHDATGEDWKAYAVALSAADRYAEAVPAWGHVPATAFAGHDDLARLRLQAFARGAADKAGATELETWLAAHRDDELVRSWLVDLWVRAGVPANAYTAVQPLTTGSDPVRWLRRSGELATSANMPDKALTSYAALMATGRATKKDRQTFTELALAAGDYARALPALDSAVAELTACDDSTLALVDRVPDARGTDRMVLAVQRLACADSQWGRRAVDRSVAEERHAEALGVIQKMTTKSDEVSRLEGLLLVWTNQPAAALPILTPVLKVRADDVEVRLAVVDAYRMTARSYDAFAAATPLLSDASLPAPRRMALAELALEADQPSTALEIATRLTASSASHDASAIRGRALLALGRQIEAATLLEGLPPTALGPAAALAAMDAVMATRGPEDAQTVGDRFTTIDGTWIPVSTRRLALAQLLGDADRAGAIRTRLCSNAPIACTIADAEAQLLLEQPVSALATLKTIERAGPTDMDRIDDLRATAFEGVGQYKEALAIVARLRSRMPSRIALTTRATVLAWRITRDEASLAAVAELPRMYPTDSDARAAVAQVFGLVGKDSDAVRLLTESGAPPLTTAGRMALAESLRAVGEPAKALAALGNTLLNTEHVAMLKSELQAAVEGPAAAIATLRVFARRPKVSEAVFLAWSALEQAGAPRAAVLQEASARLPQSGRIAAQLSTELLIAGDRAGAKQEADRAIALDPTFAPSWFAAVDAIARTGTDRELTDLLHRLKTQADHNAGLIIAVGDHVAGLVPDSKFDLARQMVSLLRSLTDKQAPGVTKHLTIARLEAALEEFDAALRAVEVARKLEPTSPQVLRMRADVLSWGGHHVEAIDAYATFLALEPDNLDARRQQARVTGWAGRYGEARKLYAALRAAYPTNAEVAAEVNAKEAFFDGRWRSAVDYYDSWIAVEPSNSEARFERAAALRSAGQTTASDAALQDLVSDTGHRLAAAALARNFDARRPVFAYASSATSARGFEGQRLLNMHREGGSVDLTIGAHPRLKLGASVDQVRAANDTRALNGYRGGVQAQYLFGPHLSVDARAGMWVFNSNATFEAQALGVWNATDRLNLQGGVNLEPVQENLTTVERGLTAAGPFAQVRSASPNTTIELRGAWQSLSDGNDRTRFTASASRIISERLRGLRLVGWAETLQYGNVSSMYFSPSRFTRVDGGLEYTHLVEKPRFGGDRQKSLQVSFLEGTDNHGVLYHHPSVAAGIELSRRFTINGTASMIRSATYQDSVVAVDIRVTGISDAR